MLKIFSIISVLIFSLNSCCRNNESKNYLLTDQHRNSIPYTDQQIIKFSNTSGEVFDVETKRSEFIQNYNFGRCAECCDELVNLEINVTEFSSSNADIIFPVIAILPYSEGGSNGAIMFYHTLYFESFRDGIFIENVPSVIYSENNRLECTYGSECLENFTVQNKIFDIVYRVDVASPVSDAIIFNYYFTITEGLIKIEKSTYDPNTSGVILTSEEYFGI